MTIRACRSAFSVGVGVEPVDLGHDPAVALDGAERRLRRRQPGEPGAERGGQLPDRVGHDVAHLAQDDQVLRRRRPPHAGDGLARVVGDHLADLGRRQRPDEHPGHRS
jgi:hypothetical protein